jgi:tRNA-dihydrouridine synthase 1
MEVDTEEDPYAFYKSVGEPKYFVAPMVDQSELPYRMLTRKYGAHICYTPMFHARLFSTSEKYRQDNFMPCKEDRPLVVQFCANDPDILLKAAKFVENDCDAVDINLGCP